MAMTQRERGVQRRLASCAFEAHFVFEENL